MAQPIKFAKNPITDTIVNHALKEGVGPSRKKQALCVGRQSISNGERLGCLPRAAAAPDVARSETYPVNPVNLVQSPPPPRAQGLPTASKPLFKIESIGVIRDPCGSLTTASLRCLLDRSLENA